MQLLYIIYINAFSKQFVSTMKHARYSTNRVAIRHILQTSCMQHIYNSPSYKPKRSPSTQPFNMV